MKKWLGLLFLIPTLALAQLKTVDLQYFPNINIVRNPGFENGRIDWQASGGSYQLVTATNIGFGSASASWQPSANAQTFKSTLASIPQGMQGSLQCSLSFYYKGSDANLNYRVVDQSSSTIAGPITLSTAAAWSAQSLSFTCPSSGFLQIVFTSTAASAVIYLDQFQLGISPSVGLISNANVASNAAIAYSKLALSNSIVNSDVNSAAAIAYSKLALAASIVNADISNSAAIAYAKLALTGSILNADLAGSIAYSKLSLTGSILNGDLAGSIADGKLATSYLKADGSRALTGNWAAGAFSSTFNSVVVGSAANTISGVSSLINGSATSSLSSLSTGTGTLASFTNWAPYTPSFVGCGTVSNVAVEFRREADSVHVRGTATLGTTTGVAVSISLPTSANTIDTTKIPGDQLALLGTLYRAAGATAFPATGVGPWVITAVTGTSTSVVFPSISTNSATPGFATVLGTSLGNSTDRIMFDFSVPVTQYAF